MFKDVWNRKKFQSSEPIIVVTTAGMMSEGQLLIILSIGPPIKITPLY